MKKIVLVVGIVAMTGFVVFASQDKCCVRAMAAQPSLTQVDAEGFQKIELQNLPHSVLRAMGTAPEFAGCRFQEAAIASVGGAKRYKILVQENDCNKEYVTMNDKGEIIN